MIEQFKKTQQMQRTERTSLANQVKRVRVKNSGNGIIKSEVLDVEPKWWSAMQPASLQTDATQADEKGAEMTRNSHHKVCVQWLEKRENCESRNAQLLNVELVVSATNTFSNDKGSHSTF